MESALSLGRTPFELRLQLRKALLAEARSCQSDHANDRGRASSPQAITVKCCLDEATVAFTSAHVLKQFAEEQPRRDAIALWTYLDLHFWAQLNQLIATLASRHFKLSLPNECAPHNCASPH
jgi:hypothetical protein